MSLASMLRALVAAGATPEVMIAAVEAVEADDAARAEAAEAAEAERLAYLRERAKERQKRYRERMALRNVTRNNVSPAVVTENNALQALVTDVACDTPLPSPSPSSSPLTLPLITTPTPSNPSEESCRVCDPTPSGKQEKYPKDFDDDFWKPYPRTPVMSKKEALAAWKKLSEADRAAAIAAVAKYHEFLRAKPDHAVVHACRFLSQRRFEGFVTNESTGPPPGLTPEQKRDWIWARVAEQEKANERQGQGIQH